jgi:hypothetical protein
VAIKRTLFVAFAAFAILSVVDYTQTAALITGSSGRVYEANPVASVWLESYGWKGLAAFKLLACGLFLGSVYLLARHRPRVGAGLAVVGCLALLTVTCYSYHLLANPPAEEDEWDETNAPLMKTVSPPITPEELREARELIAARRSSAPVPAAEPESPSDRTPGLAPPRRAALPSPAREGPGSSARLPTAQFPCP